MLEDELLKWKFKRGSQEALSRIYEKYIDLMLTLAMAMLSDSHAAEDVVQDVFVSFARSAAGFRLRGSLKAYLATAVANRARDRLRQARRRPSSLDDDVPLEAGTRGPAEQLVFTEDALRLTQAVAGLPEEQREAVVLRLKAGMAFREIARIQGVSVNTVQGRYRYALSRLRTSLNGEVET
jgi:RNA polymerase sigma-70 factor (ECF subfamily)